jgi:hypothetical protein
MKAAFVIGALLMSSVFVFAQDTAARQKLKLPQPAPLVVTKPFADNGTLVMNINVGEVRVVRSDVDKTIRLSIDSKIFYDDATVKSWVRRFDVAGSRASIDLRLPGHGNQHHGGPEITMSVPAQTDVKLDLGVGELTVKGVEGNKDLHVGIGEMNVGVADATKYHEIQTSSKLGEADDNTSSQHSNGFFPKTHRTSAQGMYKIHATVGIGQVNINQD